MTSAVALGNTSKLDMNLFESSGGLAPIDWIIIVLYAAGTILLGTFYTRRQTNLQEYFTGGGRMNPKLIGVSAHGHLAQHHRLPRHSG